MLTLLEESSVMLEDRSREAAILMEIRRGLGDAHYSQGEIGDTRRVRLVILKEISKSLKYAHSSRRGLGNARGERERKA